MALIKEEFLAAAAVALPEFADGVLADKLSLLATHLADVGSRMNLTAITEPSAVVWLHLIDSLYAARILKNAADSIPATNIADIGSGGGFPALPIAAALPQMSVTAIDSTEKKCNYILGCAEVMGLTSVTAEAVRAEEYGHTDARESYGAVTARAVARLNVLMEICLPLVRVGGLFLAMKGVSADEEEAEAAAAAEKLGAVLDGKVKYTLPGYADGRTILVYRKIAPTKAQYPRQWAKITKNPL